MNLALQYQLQDFVLGVTHDMSKELQLSLFNVLDQFGLLEHNLKNLQDFMRYDHIYNASSLFIVPNVISTTVRTRTQKTLEK